MTTNKTKPELTEEQRAILNTAFDALGANPADGWFTLEGTPQVYKAWKDGLLNHKENSKLYRLSEKGRWALGKEHPLKAKQAAIEHSASVIDMVSSVMGLPPKEAMKTIDDMLRTEQEQAKADLAGDGKQMPEDDEPDIDFGLENKLETAQYDLGLAADTIKDLERQLREAQEELQAERNLRAADQKRIDELKVQCADYKRQAQEISVSNQDLIFTRKTLQQANEQLLKEKEQLKADLQVALERAENAEKTGDAAYDAAQELRIERKNQMALIDEQDEAIAQLTAERDALDAGNSLLILTIAEQNAKIEALGQAAADGQALMAAAQVFAVIIERAKKTPEATAPTAAEPGKATEPDTSGTIVAGAHRPMMFGFLDGKNPAAGAKK